MFKKIKNFICKLLGIKQCACPEDMQVEVSNENKPKPTYLAKKRIVDTNQQVSKNAKIAIFRKTCPFLRGHGVQAGSIGQKNFDQNLPKVRFLKLTKFRGPQESRFWQFKFQSCSPLISISGYFPLYYQ